MINNYVDSAGITETDAGHDMHYDTGGICDTSGLIAAGDYSDTTSSETGCVTNDTGVFSNSHPNSTYDNYGHATHGDEHPAGPRGDMGDVNNNVKITNNHFCHNKGTSANADKGTGLNNVIASPNTEDAGQRIHHIAQIE